MGFYGNIATADQLRKDIWFSSRQFKLIKGKRAIGKTYSGDSWCFGRCILEHCNVWIITPIFKDCEHHIANVKTIAKSCKNNPILSINKRNGIVTTFQPYNSRLYMIGMKDLFGTFPIVREVPDYIFIDDGERYEDEELRKIHRKLQEIMITRNGNPTVLIAYTPVRKMDRLQALWKVANYKDNWDRFETFEGDTYEEDLCRRLWNTI